MKAAWPWAKHVLNGGDKSLADMLDAPQTPEEMFATLTPVVKTNGNPGETGDLLRTG